jgi:hypothetical protein
MYQVIITVATNEEAETIVGQLGIAEEEGGINFAFNTEIKRIPPGKQIAYIAPEIEPVKENEMNYTSKSISQLANIIRADWKKVYFAAVPYLDAMRQLDTIGDNYGLDSGKTIVIYFLSNAGTWRGEVAKAVKAELKRRAGIK